MNNPHVSCTFSKPLADSRDYPPTRFPASPPSESAAPPTAPLLREPPTGTAGAMRAPRARYGIALAARALLPRGAVVLVPAYHCPAMIEPLLWAGCRVDFYRMRPDLTPAPDDFLRRLASADAVLLTRYFGFNSAVDDCAALARKAGKLIIEDLAHTAFSSRLVGDLAVTSLGKFFPCTEGAELFIADPEHYRRITATRKAMHVSKTAWRAKDVVRRLRRRLGRRTHAAEFRYFDSLEMSRPIEDNHFIASNGLSEATIAEHRRANYLRLEQVVASTLPSAMVFGPLPNDQVPYVFPLLLPTNRGFHALRQAGIPVQRWEELAKTSCPVSLNYRERLLQLPIHQAMTDSQVGHVAETLHRFLDKSQQRDRHGR